MPNMQFIIRYSIQESFSLSFLYKYACKLSEETKEKKCTPKLHIQPPTL